MSIKCSMTNEDYKLLNDAYYGEGGFADGSYLTAHIREDTQGKDSKYEIRKRLSYYENYIQPVVDSHVNAVFSSEPTRVYIDQNKFYELFIKDADACGNSLNRVLKAKALKAKLKGCVLMVVDNYNAMPEDVATAQETRSFPYVFHVDPENIIYDDCIFDNRKNMVQVGYYEDNFIDDKGKTYKQKRVWTNNKSQLFRQSKDQTNIEETEWILSSESVHGLGILPCFFFNGTSNLDNTTMVTSQFLHPAKINKAIFNICSEIRETQRQQCFSILTMPGSQPEGGLTLGVNNVLYYPEEGTHEPNFLAPDTAPIDHLVSYSKELINEIYRMSCVSYTQQYANSQQSGESKRWTFHITRQVLEDFAVNCEDCERKIAKIFGKYIKHDLQLQVDYNRSYGADDVDADIERTDVVLKMELPDAVKVEVIKKFVKSYFAEDDDSTIKLMYKAIDEYLVELQAAKQEDSTNGDNSDDNNEDEDLMNE